jgi:hypothetical protein
MKKIKRNISEKIEKDTIVIVVNISIIIKAKKPKILILNLGLEGYTFILQFLQKFISVGS